MVFDNGMMQIILVPVFQCTASLTRSLKSSAH